MTDIWMLIDKVWIPVIVGLIAWVWKLDDRVYMLGTEVLKRDEFNARMDQLRMELQELRRLLNHDRRAE